MLDSEIGGPQILIPMDEFAASTVLFSLSKSLEKLLKGSVVSMQHKWLTPEELFEILSTPDTGQTFLFQGRIVSLCWLECVMHKQ